MVLHALHHQISKDKLCVQTREIEKERRFKFEGEESAFLPSSTGIHHSEGTGTSTAHKDRCHWFVAKKKRSNGSRRRKSNTKIKTYEIDLLNRYRIVRVPLIPKRDSV